MEGSAHRAGLPFRQIPGQNARLGIQKRPVLVDILCLPLLCRFPGRHIRFLGSCQPVKEFPIIFQLPLQILKRRFFLLLLLLPVLRLRQIHRYIRKSGGLFL